jgi:hypothetical protein
MDMVSNQVEEDVRRALADDPRAPYLDEIVHVKGISNEIKVVERL